MRNLKDQDLCNYSDAVKMGAETFCKRHGQGALSMLWLLHINHGAGNIVKVEAVTVLDGQDARYLVTSKKQFGEGTSYAVIVGHTLKYKSHARKFL